MCTRHRYEGPLVVDPRIARLLRVHLHLPRALVEDIVRAQCCTKIRRYSDGSREEIPYVCGERHGIARWWRADGSRDCEIPYVRGKRHGTATFCRADGSRWCETPYVNGKAHGSETWWRADGSLQCESPYVNDDPHGTVTWWRADGAVNRVEEWAHGVRRK
jgi:antitoxin component YwqK of YwqJK toxin-antitoxin module